MYSKRLDPNGKISKHCKKMEEAQPKAMNLHIKTRNVYLCQASVSSKALFYVETEAWHKYTFLVLI